MRGVGEATVAFSDNGVTRLAGPVGAGKSTVIGAIPWVLFGHVPAGTTISDLRKDGSEDDVTASVEFVHDGKTYIAERSLKQVTRSGKAAEKPSAALSIDGVRQPSMAPKALTTAIEDVLGVTGSQFVESLFIPQNGLSGLAEATPAKVLAALEGQAGVVGVDDAAATARKAAKALKVKAGETAGAIEAYEEALLVRASAVELAATADARLAEAREALRDAETSDEAARAAVTAAVTAQQSHATAQAGITAARAERARIGDVCPARQDTDVLSTRLREARAAAQNASVWDANHQRLSDAVAESETALAQSPPPAGSQPADPGPVCAARDAASTARDELLTRFKDLQARANNLDEAGECPTCLRPGADGARTSELLRTEMEKIRSEGKAAAEELSRLTAEAEAVSEAHAVWEAAMDAHSTAKKGLAAARASLEALGDRPDTPDPEAIEAALAAADTANRDADTWDRLTVTIEQALPAPVSEAEIAAAREASEATAVKLSAARVAVQEAMTDAAVKKEQVTSAQRMCDAYAGPAADAQETADAFEVAHAESMILTEFRQKVLGTYCEALSSTASGMLEATGGEHVAVSIDDDFVIQVTSASGTTIPLRRLSGGEKARCALFLRAAMAGQLPGWMLFADEVTANMDPVTAQEVIDVFTAAGRPMVVIGHTEHLAAAAQTTVDMTAFV